MMAYAADTSVPVERSRAELERTLQRYGASAFAYGWDETGRVVIRFKAHSRLLRFDVALPLPTERRFTQTAQHRDRTQKAAQEAWEQACRQKWRALNLVIKAKLEAVEADIATFEDEFLAHIELPDGRTFGQWAGPQVAAVYDNAGYSLPALLPG